MLASTALWWTTVQIARWCEWPVPWAVPITAAHGVFMAFAFIPLFFVGFLFTAGPRWLGLPPVAARAVLRPVLIYAIAWLAYAAAVHLSVTVAALCVATAAAAWATLAARYRQMVRQSPVEDRTHAGVIVIASTLGAIILGLAAVAVGSESYSIVRLLILVGLWGFMVPIYLAVAHRMIPFFTLSVLPQISPWRPSWLLTSFVVLTVLGFASAFIDAVLWPVPVALRSMQIVAEMAIAAGLVTLSVRWGLLASFRVRLLAMLHVGFAWLGVAFALSACVHAAALTGAAPATLHLAPLHALTMGFMGATLLAMATRVSAGHGGGPLIADNWAWGLFWLQQVATLLRIIAALPEAATWLVPLASTLWAVATVTWAVQHLNRYGRARLDGKPG